MNDIDNLIVELEPWSNLTPTATLTDDYIDNLATYIIKLANAKFDEDVKFDLIRDLLLTIRDWDKHE